MSDSKARRKEQTATQRNLTDRVSAILFDADPVGINFDSNADEYEAEAEAIVIALPEATGIDDVTDIAYGAFVQWFDVETAGQREQYIGVAAQIWDEWRRCDERSVPRPDG